MLSLLNFRYDSTPAEYISMIVTDYGMVRFTHIVVVQVYIMSSFML